MDISGLLAFAAIYLVAVASPGPGIALVVARSLGRGLHGLPWFVAGFVLGDLILLALAASGLAVVARTFEGAFLALRLAGAAYLLYLAWCIWNASSSSASASPPTFADRRFGRRHAPPRPRSPRQVSCA